MGVIATWVEVTVLETVTVQQERGWRLEVGGLNMAAVGEENTSSNVSSSTVKKSANPSETHRD